MRVLLTGTIIDSGSASFEIIRGLTAKLPVMVAPRWVRTRTQPIGIADVLAYLKAGLSLGVPDGAVVDIGAEPMSFRELLLGAARVMGLRRHVVSVPLFSPRLSSYWLNLMTPATFSRMTWTKSPAGFRPETARRSDRL